MIALVALIIIQLSTLPVIFGYTTLPPIEMMAPILVGNLLLFYDATFEHRINNYAIGFGLGCILQLIIIVKIILVYYFN